VSDWKHDALASDLAAHLRGYSKPMIAWENMQLGPSGSIRPDVFGIEKTYTALRAIAFEVKVSRADFLSDVTAGKYLGYFKVAGALSFAAPKGLLKRDEIPEGCGFIERGPESWRWVRRPTINRLEQLPWQVWLKLVIDGIERAHDPRSECRRQRTSEWEQSRRIEERLGKDFARMVADRERAAKALQFEIQRDTDQVSELRAKREQRERERQQELEERLQLLRNEIDALGQSIGIPEASRMNQWDLRLALSRARPDKDREALHELQNKMRFAAAEIERALGAARDAGEAIGARIGAPLEDAA